MTKSEFLNKYGKEHIIVYIGYELQKSGLFRSKSVAEPEPGKYMIPLRHSEIYIDEMLFTSSYDHPFACFDVGPGMHKLEIWSEFAGMQFTTDARPARVRDSGSVMIAVKFVYFNGTVYRFIKEFTDIDEFIDYTGNRMAFAGL